MMGPLLKRLEQEEDAASRLEIIEQALRPPEPQLLDTCVIQNLDWIDCKIESEGSVTWDDAAVGDLTRKYGAELASDLIDLGILYKQLERRGEYPWLVCDAAKVEASRLRGPIQQRLGQLFRFFRGHQEDWSIDAYPGIALGLLFASQRVRVSPLILRGLGVRSTEEIYVADGPLSFLRDLGDRVVVAHALLANIPVVMTTDRARFWRYHSLLNELGLEVMRPSEVLQLYVPYWDALDTEFARRRAATQ